MPNASVLEQKKAIVAELTEKLQNAASGVLVDYKGITVAEDTALRNELRKNNVGTLSSRTPSPALLLRMPAWAICPTP